MNKRSSFKIFWVVLFPIAFFWPGCRAAEECMAGNTLRSLGGEAIPMGKMEATVEQLMIKAGVTGLSCAVINDGKIVYVKAFGYRNKKQETRFFVRDSDYVFSF